MCGIIGYLGPQNSLSVVLGGLKALEYRGYDSAGAVWFEKQKLCWEKTVGKIETLTAKISLQHSDPQTAAIGHTRWATHGEPTARNAHPHFDCQRNIFLVHNGIIENYQELKEKLVRNGHHFHSQTDSEIVAHLLEEGLKKHQTLEKTLPAVLKQIIGAYALAIIHRPEPNKIYFARLGSPLIVGLQKNEHWLASDPAALAGLAKKVIYLKDRHYGYIDQQKLTIRPTRPSSQPLAINPVQAQKGNFPHFMLKEIFEGPEALAAALRGRLYPQKKIVKLGGLERVASLLSRIKKMELVACGTSFYAGLIGEMLLEEIAGLPAKTSTASEYRYRPNVSSLQTASLFISQSGETADTLAALRQAKKRKRLTLGLVNVVGSAIARETKAGVYNHAGPEIGVASTKAFLSQVAILTLIALYLKQQQAGRLAKLFLNELATIPQKAEKVLRQDSAIKKLAKKYQSRQNFIFLGRRYNYPVALEGALKLKEIGYVHAEGQPAGELKHGPLALIEPGFPVIALATQNSVYEKMLSNLQEIKARRGRILAIATTGDKKIAGLADDVIYLPQTLEPLEPLLNIIPLQLFAYHFGVQCGYNVDQPRNLAKSVTVE